MLPINPSFSSRQELLTSASPQHCRPNSPASSGLPSSTDGPIQSKIFTRASSLPGRLERRFRVEAPVEVSLLPADGAQLCGWGSFTPRALQLFNTPPWMLFFLCLASFLQGMIINGFINTIITSIERRFDLRSYQTGLIASSYDIAACVCLAFVSYFGGTGHKPRWLGWGMLIMASGSLVFALPHFASAPYRASVSEQTELCAANRSSPCQDKEAAQSSYRFLFMLGQLLHGVGATPLYTLGVTYLDENVRSNYAPVYIGIFYTAAILGPAVGYLLGGYFLNIYTEIHLRTDLSPEDPHWVGAWWIGFLLGGAAVLLVSLPILGYPRQLPGSQEFVAMRVSEVHQLSDGSHSTASDPQFGRSAKDMPRSLLLLLKNPTFLFLCLAGATEATLIAGMSTFGPKFLESQFGLSASEAATWFGYMVVPAGGGGTFLGGYIVKKWNMRCRDIVRLCVVCTLISLVTIFIFLLHCPNMPMAGVTVPYRSGQVQNQQLHRGPTEPHSSALEENLTESCNAACGCVAQMYDPVCGADATMYYSPCHAGCRALNHTEASTGKRVYSGCSCVLANVSSPQEALALSGKCSSSCQRMPTFLIFLFSTIFFTFLCSIPALTATLRCVPDSQRSFGLGIQWIVVRTLGGCESGFWSAPGRPQSLTPCCVLTGSIPGPIAFGSMIDMSCLLWQAQCGHQGSCSLYQNAAMSRHILTAGAVYKVPSSLASVSHTQHFPSRFKLEGHMSEVGLRARTCGSVSPP
uniref:Solute carrier organic anion transporter family member n=1 Tax=Takifugu rubripes TaxID=31033 RepID=A0A3B5KDF3_TAKRU